MSWIRLLFIEYDISSINSQGFLISHTSKSVKDINFNNIIYIPFLINNHYNLYKLEIQVKKYELFIFLYINYFELFKIVQLNELIPYRNQLFEILKKNKHYFKFNENDFNNLNKPVFNWSLIDLY